MHHTTAKGDKGSLTLQGLVDKNIGKDAFLLRTNPGQRITASSPYDAQSRIALECALAIDAKIFKQAVTLQGSFQQQAKQHGWPRQSVFTLNMRWAR